MIAVAWGLMGVGFWVLLILLIALLVAATRTPARGAGGPAAGGQAIRVLEERYARGEITREEFLERREVLRSPPGP
jgi:putative membrane protein